MKRLKTTDDKEVGENSEIRGLLYELALEMKSMNESMTVRMDKLESTSWKNIVENITEIRESKIKKEIGEVKDHLNTEMNTVNKRIDGLVNKINEVIKEVEQPISHTRKIWFAIRSCKYQIQTAKSEDLSPGRWKHDIDPYCLCAAYLWRC